MEHRCWRPACIDVDWAPLTLAANNAVIRTSTLLHLGALAPEGGVPPHRSAAPG